MFSRIFGWFDTAYLIRAYVFSGAILAFTFWLYAFQLDYPRSGPQQASLIGLFTACAVLFPFSKLVWDEIKSVLLRGNVLLVNIVVAVPAKLLVNAMLWYLAIFIAPFGIAYVWFRTRA